MPFRGVLVIGYLLATGHVIWLVGGSLGREIFPAVDTGQFQLRLRAPDGTRIEGTKEIAREALAVIREEAGTGPGGEENVAGSIRYVGLIGSSYPINTIYLWMRGPEEAVLRIALREGSGVRVEALKHRLREELPRRLGDVMRGYQNTCSGSRTAGPCARRSRSGAAMGSTSKSSGGRRRPASGRSSRERNGSPAERPASRTAT
jgi:multidrug efflux pump subunit AcrB